MPKFLFVYHGGKRPEGKDEIDKAMAAWGKWMSDHAKAIVDPGNPVGLSKIVSAGGVANNGGTNPAFGYSIVEAADMDAACAIAAENPMVTNGPGSVEVAPLIDM